MSKQHIINSIVEYCGQKLLSPTSSTEGEKHLTSINDITKHASISCTCLKTFELFKLSEDTFNWVNWVLSGPGDKRSKTVHSQATIARPLPLPKRKTSYFSEAANGPILRLIT